MFDDIIVILTGGLYCKKSSWFTLLESNIFINNTPSTLIKSPDNVVISPIPGSAFGTLLNI